MRNNKLLLAIAATMVSSSLYAMETERTFAEIDNDGDGLITKEEFRSVGQDFELFSAYDTDGDGYLADTDFDETGYESTYFTDWDMNEDGMLDEDEWFDGVFSYYDDDEDWHWEEGEWQKSDDDGFWDF